MLQALMNVPITEEDWFRWGFHHEDSHAVIRKAILDQRSIRLIDYQIYPINFDHTDYFLQRNQKLHNDMNGVMKTQGSDLQLVDLSDKGQLSSWIYSHFLEHQNVMTALGI